MPARKPKDSVSLNARIGPDTAALLKAACEELGQSKTVAVERAIWLYCTGDPLPPDKAREPGGTP